LEEEEALPEMAIVHTLYLHIDIQEAEGLELLVKFTTSQPQLVMAAVVEEELQVHTEMVPDYSRQD
jgi:hypothetical protein